MNIVLAPHIDDEVIGVYSLLSEKKIDVVYYFYDITEERKVEAIKASKIFSFKPIFRADKINVKKGDNIYVPGMYDIHNDHKKINRLGKELAYKNKANLFFYSIDMNRKPRLIENFKAKEKHLKSIFKSQKSLFNNEKYFLFEDIYQYDFKRFCTFKHLNFIIELEMYKEENINNFLNGLVNEEEIVLKLSKKYPGNECIITSDNIRTKYML